jgi:hypothetical protein
MQANRRIPRKSLRCISHGFSEWMALAPDGREVLGLTKVCYMKLKVRMRLVLKLQKVNVGNAGRVRDATSQAQNLGGQSSWLRRGILDQGLTKEQNTGDSGEVGPETPIYVAWVVISCGQISSESCVLIRCGLGMSMMARNGGNDC